MDVVLYACRFLLHSLSILLFSWWRQASKQAGLAGEPGKQAPRPRGLIECLVVVYDMVRVGMAVWDEWMGWMDG
jgi:hypothetical protein